MGYPIEQKTVACATKNQGGYHEKNLTRYHTIRHMVQGLYSVILFQRLQQACQRGNQEHTTQQDYSRLCTQLVQDCTVKPWVRKHLQSYISDCLQGLPEQ